MNEHRIAVDGDVNVHELSTNTINVSSFLDVLLSKMLIRFIKDSKKKKKVRLFLKIN